jgi:hypothetical protein
VPTSATVTVQNNPSGWWPRDGHRKREPESPISNRRLPKRKRWLAGFANMTAQRVVRPVANASVGLVLHGYHKPPRFLPGGKTGFPAVEGSVKSSCFGVSLLAKNFSSSQTHSND